MAHAFRPEYFTCSSCVACELNSLFDCIFARLQNFVLYEIFTLTQSAVSKYKIESG